MSVGALYNYFPSKKSLAKASIKLVTGKLASKLREINEKKISQKDKIYEFIHTYFIFLEKHPEMIEYFFKVYLSNRELFCEEEKCGFYLAEEFISEVERLINAGVDNGEFRKMDFHVAFSLVIGIIGAMSFLNGEGVLKEDLDVYSSEISDAIYRTLSCESVTKPYHIS